MSMAGAPNYFRAAIKRLESRVPHKKIFDQPIPAKKWKINKGDVVAIINGPETGKQGKIVGIQRANNRVHIEGVNMRRRTEKSPSPGVPGKIITYPGPIHVSNIQLIDPEGNVPTKIWRRYTDEGEKVRVSKASGSIIPKPEWKREKPRAILKGPKDTDPENVYEVTYEKYIARLHPNSRKSESNEGDT